MNGTGTIVLALGVGGAIFLYMRSRAEQAAALAAAQSAPGPGLVTKLENTAKGIATTALNTFKSVGGSTVKAVSSIPTGIKTVASTPLSIGSSLLGGGSSVTYQQFISSVSGGRL